MPHREFHDRDDFVVVDKVKKSTENGTTAIKKSLKKWLFLFLLQNACAMWDLQCQLKVQDGLSHLCEDFAMRPRC